MKLISKENLNILWAISFVLILGSCSKDSGNCDPNDETSPCYAGVPAGAQLLLVETRKNGITELKFDYDAQNRIIKRYIYAEEGGLHTEHHTYKDKKLITVRRMAGEDLVMGEEYFYGTGDKPISAVLTNNKNEIDVNVTYSYSGSDVTETSYDTEGNLLGTNTYTFDEKGNPLMRKTGSLGHSLVEILGDYDNNPYAFTNHPWAWKTGSTNNPRSYSRTLEGMDVPGANVDQVWEYTYNDAGYPIKAEVFDRESDALVETHTFIYKTIE